MLDAREDKAEYRIVYSALSACLDGNTTFDQLLAKGVVVKRGKKPVVRTTTLKTAKEVKHVNKKKKKAKKAEDKKAGKKKKQDKKQEEDDEEEESSSDSDSDDGGGDLFA